MRQDYPLAPQTNPKSERVNPSLSEFAMHLCHSTMEVNFKFCSLSLYRPSLARGTLLFINLQFFPTSFGFRNGVIQVINSSN